MQIISYLALFFFIIFTANLESQELSLGLRLQQSWNMYNENGFTLQFAPKNLLNDQLSFGASYISTRFGSAFNSNAIIQDNMLLHSTYVFSSSSLSPLVRLNAGYCFADYESSLFDEIDSSMPLLSLEAGAKYTFDIPLEVQASLGYNFVTSDGSSGIGTVYLYAPPKIVPVIIRDYSLIFGKKQYEKDTIFGDANSHHSTVS